jgi:RhtB (resistance to homoserine/threonine) family protein
MEYLALIGTVTVINMLGAISPGPDFIVTVRHSLRYSRRSGIFTGLGIALGLLVHITYCAAGVGLIISQSAVLFSIMKVLGACYLMYLGIHSITSKESKIAITDEKQTKDLNAFSSFRTGFLTNLLNPKATLFFLSLFTFVIHPNTPLWVILVCAVIVFLTALIWFSTVAIFLTKQSVQKAFLKFERPINFILGGILIYLGIQVALMLFK